MLAFQPAECQPEMLSALICAQQATVTELRVIKKLLGAFPCSRSAQAHNEVYQHTLDISFKPVHSVVPQNSHSSVSISAAAEAAGRAMDAMLVTCIQKRVNPDGKSAAEVKPNDHVVQSKAEKENGFPSRQNLCQLPDKLVSTIFWEVKRFSQ